jgi:MoaA/NifB/PqqE/SkfB family radical SAM enzyme
MKENEQFLKHLLKVNPDVQLRVNTNLSKTQTRVFDLVCEFKNVHWTVSVDTIEDQFEYVRYGGRWVDFIENLNKINTLGHKISFNMLWFVLNYITIFDCVDYLKQQGFHNNSFIIGPVVDPKALDVRNLPDKLLNTARQILTERISAKPGFLLEESYSNMLNYINTPFDGDLKQSLAHIDSINKRRGVDSSQVFGNLYKALSDV